MNLNPLQRRLMEILLKQQARDEAMIGAKRDTQQEPLLKPELGLSLGVDAMKMLAAGNSAGSVGSLAAMYYFGARPELHFAIKTGAFAFVFGAMSIGGALYCLIYGLFSASHVTARLNTFDDPMKVPNGLMKQAANAVAFLLASIGLSFFSFACFLVGIGIALYALTQL